VPVPVTVHAASAAALAKTAATHAARVVEALAPCVRLAETVEEETDIEPPIDDEKSWELYKKRAAFTNPEYAGVTLFT
jgi:hypothetical protein